eukprot:m.234655 g.234655  ORF g.234655 m.234655 type:complete len:626 (+) comp18916_c5_seq9:1308-3185(+)
MADDSIARRMLGLGIDIGTSSVKATFVEQRDDGSFVVVAGNQVAYDSEDLAVAVASAPSLMETVSLPRVAGAAEQDPVVVVAAVQLCVTQLPRDLKQQVRSIGLTGQMHGVVLFNTSKQAQHTTQQDPLAQAPLPPALVNARSALPGAVGAETSAETRPQCPNNGHTLWHTLVSCSPLFTWRDARCTPEFLDTLVVPEKQPYPMPSTGFGCSTLAWLATECGEYVDKFAHAAGIADLVGCLLCDGRAPVMDTTQASSWGWFDPGLGTWATDAIGRDTVRQQRIARVLPASVVAPGTVMGRLSSHAAFVLGLPTTPAIHVCVASGDHQCHVTACMALGRAREDGCGGGPSSSHAMDKNQGTGTTKGQGDDGRHESLAATRRQRQVSRATSSDRRMATAVLSVGTSAQLSVLVPASDPLLARLKADGLSSVEVRPSMHSDWAVVSACALTGGGAILATVDALFRLAHDVLGTQPGAGARTNGGAVADDKPSAAPDDVWERLLGLAEQRLDETTLAISPTFWGERRDPAARGSVCHLVAGDNLTAGDWLAATCTGVADNLCSMLPPDLLSGREADHCLHVLATGTAVCRSRLLQRCFARRLGTPHLDVVPNGDAATGAAITALTSTPP